jgi:hypothetical protein
VLLVQTRGKHESSKEGFHGCRLCRDVRKVLEAREQESRGWRTSGCVLGHNAGIFARATSRNRAGLRLCGTIGLMCYGGCGREGGVGEHYVVVRLEM